MKSEVKHQLDFGFANDKELSSSLPLSLPMPDAEVIIYPNFFEKEESDKIFQELFRDIKWRQDEIEYYGKKIDLPRLTAWYGDFGKSYTYSSILMNSDAWTPTLLFIKERIEKVANVFFNSVLLNLYRNGRDSVSWHRDNEPELGENPVIASVSFGETRKFQFRHRLRKELGKIDVDLTHGSLLIMKGATQQFWQHQIPKTSKHVAPRINLTFRIIK